jgi:hypothetical protein
MYMYYRYYMYSTGTVLVVVLLVLLVPGALSSPAAATAGGRPKRWQTEARAPSSRTPSSAAMLASRCQSSDSIPVKKYYFD